MERTIKDLSKEELDKLEWIMLHACANSDPWADMMFLGGAGDEDATAFPLNLDEVESIDISFVKREEPQETTA